MKAFQVNEVDGKEPQNLSSMSFRLSDAVASFVKALKFENLSEPSLRPSEVKKAPLRSKEGKNARSEIIEIAKMILATAMEPEENLLITSLQFHTCTCLKVAIDLKLHEFIPVDRKVSAEKLASCTGAEETVLIRILRVLTSKHIFFEVEPRMYRHTSVSWILTRPNMPHLVGHRLDEGFRSSSRQADALALSGYREPHTSDTLGFNLAFATQKSYWEYIQVDSPERGQRFSRAMEAVNVNNLANIPETYPFQNLMKDGGVIVDIGGGHGHVAHQVVLSNKDVGLKIIVQDAKCVVDQRRNNMDPSIEFHVHDFFSPQPVQGAAAYFLRHIFHDWSDQDCLIILRSIIPAMDQKRSRILICDQIVRDWEPTATSVLYDFDMMCFLGGKERTRSQWEMLLRKADARLHIAKVWRNECSAATILEARLLY